MDAGRLVELGFTKREASAYLALLSLEEAKAGQIAERTSEDRTNIYDSLRSLAKKGIVSVVMKDKKKYYRAAPPDRLKDYMAEKEKVLDEILPGLTDIYKSYKPKPVIEVYEGKEGIKAVFSDILRDGKDFVGFGATDRAMALLPEFTTMYLRERTKRNIRARQLYPRGGQVLRSEVSVFKEIPEEFSGPATTLVYGDKVAIFMWFIEPLAIVLIKNAEAAKAYRNQFEYMWKMTK